MKWFVVIFVMKIEIKKNVEEIYHQIEMFKFVKEVNSFIRVRWDEFVEKKDLFILLIIDFHLKIELNRFNGFIQRNLVQSSICQSSSWKYCCKDDLCNDLPFIPRPPFKSLICYSDQCQIQRKSNGIIEEKCFHSNSIAFRSNVLQSCFVRFFVFFFVLTWCLIRWINK